VANLPVLALQTELEVAKPEEPQIIAQLQQAPVKAVQPAGEEVELAQVVQTAPPPAAVAVEPVATQADVPPAQVALTRLPDTASYLPLIAACWRWARPSLFAPFDVPCSRVRHAARHFLTGRGPRIESRKEKIHVR